MGGWLARLMAPWAADRSVARAADTLYCAVVAQARLPAHYGAGGVADTVDGRFDLIVLHLWLLSRRLRGEGEAGAALAQALLDTTFDDMDRSLREMGVGDLGVGRKVKAMAQAWRGRSEAYERAIGEDDAQALALALGRNLLNGGDGCRLAAYVGDAERALAAQPGARLLAGEVVFPAPPGEQ